VTELSLTYDLQILPVLMQFECHAELAFPIEAIDADRIGAWIDDRLVRFIKPYLEMQSNENSLKDQMVEDPVAQVRLPKFAAEVMREKDGVKYYFISEETAAELFKRETNKSDNSNASGNRAVDGVAMEY
jgi:YHS domain-containing protein